MDQSDPARDPLRSLAEAALTRQETTQRQRADDQAAVDRDQADQAEAADQAQTLAEAQQLAAEVFGAEGAELAAGLTWTAVGPGQATATINEHVLVYHRTPVLWTRARAAPTGCPWTAVCLASPRSPSASGGAVVTWTVRPRASSRCTSSRWRDRSNPACNLPSASWW